MIFKMEISLVSMPASEAYCERVFSVCGELSAGKRNRLSVSMEKRVFMKLNRQLLSKLICCIQRTELTVNDRLLSDFTFVLV